MPIDRRLLLTTGFMAVGLSAAAEAGARPSKALKGKAPAGALAPSDTADQTLALQAALDAAAASGTPVELPAGTFRAGPLVLRSGARLVGAGPRTILEYIGGGTFVTADGADDIALEDLTIDGQGLALDARRVTGLLDFRRAKGVSLDRVRVRRSLLNGVALSGVGGRVTDCDVASVSRTGIFSIDAAGLEIRHCTVAECGNNGIQVWREAAGMDGTIVAANRVTKIAAKEGGSGENGNGINVYRAGGVIVSGNHISDCAYSAVRGNTASDLQIVGNSCFRSGEVALYAEFAFEGALIANNLVDEAASGIAVTNFNEGGRLAVVQGNIIRNLFRREAEPQDKRGEGISIEADAVVSGNVIENAPTSGISAGWGKYLRDVVISGNLVRGAGIGIALSGIDGAGSCLVSQNLISGASRGAIFAMDHATPIGEDLAIAPSGNPKLAVSGNVVT